MNFSQRLNRIPPLLYDEIDEIKYGILKSGGRVIDFGVGDPDLPPPSWALEEIKKSFDYGPYNRYPSTRGDIELRQAVANYYKRRFSVELNPETEVMILVGAKEGIAHLAVACAGNSDIILVPTPAYPVYYSSTHLAGALPYEMPLLELNSYLPDLGNIPDSVLRFSRLMHINYPNNPTSACASLEFFKEAAEFGLKNNIIISHDNAYGEVMLNGRKPMSFLQAPGAKETGIEFGSWSKNYNAAGWRIAYVAGNAQVISALFKVKTNVDSGVCRAIQQGAKLVMDKGDSFIQEMCDIYTGRREMFEKSLVKAGFETFKSDGTFYIWAKIPDSKQKSLDFVKYLLKKTGILCSPGSGFGVPGEGYLRFSLSLADEQIKEAAGQLENL